MEHKLWKAIELIELNKQRRVTYERLNHIRLKSQKAENIRLNDQNAENIRRLKEAKG